MSESVAYFAYGSNTCSDVLVRRRGITPLASEAAELRDHRLAFVHPGVPLIEPAFASVLPEAGSIVHGVLHVLRAADMQRLDRTESGAYDRVERSVIGRVRGTVSAQIYVTRHPRSGRAPSRRYRDLIVRGAREHALPASWIADLEALPCAYVPVISDAMPRIVELFHALRDRR